MVSPCLRCCTESMCRMICLSAKFGSLYTVTDSCLSNANEELELRFDAFDSPIFVLFLLLLSLLILIFVLLLLLLSEFCLTLRFGPEFKRRESDDFFSSLVLSLVKQCVL
jgi:hypothetical protein